MQLDLFDKPNSFGTYGIQVGITLILVILYIILKSISVRLVNRHGRKNDIAINRVMYIRKLINFLLIGLIMVLIGVTWEISMKGLSVYFTSVFTVVGVGLFANWSILSNITASIILFFFFPYRIGDKITIVDGDNSETGEILDIQLFYIKIKTDKNRIVSYPNNLIIQKPTAS